MLTTPCRPPTSPGLDFAERSSGCRRSGLKSSGVAPFSSSRYVLSERLLFPGRARDEVEAQRIEDVWPLEEVAVAGGGDQPELGVLNSRHNLPSKSRGDEDVIFGDADERRTADG